MIWSKQETLTREQMNALQLERLKETVKRVYEKVEPYRKKMDEAGVKPEDIKTLADLAKLPFVTNQNRSLLVFLLLQQYETVKHSFYT